ncbi:replication-relaxation family protein [Phytohabitans suffuscus]|uniref:replication-relaxation family protein n=1 Tax=Phytohabitans suffuscus TaxID=624315 RepID=UPI001566D231|nr:replication-relaxation family protein [Phytohabitans suffuscus]
MTTTHPNPFTVPSPKPVPADLFLDEVGRTTGRDRWAILMIAEHRILTTAQLTTLGFHPDPAGTERRLRILSRRGWLDRFSIGPTRTNTIESVWCLGPLGAVMATPPADPIPSPARTYRQQQRLWAHPHLAELWDLNQFFVNLAAHARANDGTDLRAWWSPRTCHGVLTPAATPPGTASTSTTSSGTGSGSNPTPATPPSPPWRTGSTATRPSPNAPAWPSCCTGQPTRTGKPPCTGSWPGSTCTS